MEEGIKFTRTALRNYFATDFALGKDFAPAYEGMALVGRSQKGGVRELRESFVDHMDSTTYNLRIPYDRMVAIYNAMRRPEAETYREQRLDYLHRALTWYAFHRRQRVSIEAFAERVGVHERTVARWLNDALDHVADAITGNGSDDDRIIYPASFVSIEGTSGATAIA